MSIPLRPAPRRPFVAALAAMVLLAACATLTQPWQAPEVTLVGLRPKALELDRQVFIATLKVRNPNDRTLPIKAMTYRLSLEGSEVAEGGGALERQIPPQGESLVDVEVAGSLLGLLPRLPALMARDRPLDWTVTGTASLAGGLLPLPYRYSGQVDPRELLARANAVAAPARPPASRRPAAPDETPPTGGRAHGSATGAIVRVQARSTGGDPSGP